MTKQSTHVPFLTVPLSVLQGPTHALIFTGNISKSFLFVPYVITLCYPWSHLETHMKQVHTGVQEVVQEASGGPSPKKSKNSIKLN